MSLSFNKNENPPTTCSLLLRIVILALVVQFANSVRNEYRWGLGFRGFQSKKNFDSTVLLNDERKNPDLYLYKSPIQLTVNYGVINEHGVKNRDAFDAENREPSFSYDNHLSIPKESEVDALTSNDYSKKKLTPKQWIDAAFKSRNDLDYNNARFEGTINSRQGETVDDAVARKNENMTQEEMFKPKVPAECEGKTVCSKTEYYPMEIVEQLVRKLKEDNVIMLPPSNPINVGSRSSATEDIQNLCRTTTSLQEDKAIAVNGTWYYVLQTPEYVQMIEHIVCDNSTESHCENVSGITDGLNAKNASVCKQHYIERYIYTLDKVNGKPALVFRPLQIPSGCCCHYRN
ncbi:uncharacterized protein LOC124303646 [Neodiprion virginianus]|uniref:uncharacterized protein LOC124303646 n=1 Tax=Neodiprion virginianus TaxID=2961670 RepID=UPI001EE74FDA|nr:uncharacterized protein LOC124303646 [Neodiprion virginianus]